jgi:hypothetical protein
MIPLGLAKLAKVYDIAEGKSWFPYHFVQPETLNYIGRYPGVEFMDKTHEPGFWEWFNAERYSARWEYGERWNLRTAAIEYAEGDVRILYEIILKFQAMAIEHIGMDPLKSLTLASLAFKVYRTLFLEDTGNQIAILTGPHADAIREAYYGGIVEHYKPYGEGLYHYDINSQYPFAMKNPMPVGAPIFTNDRN